MCKCVNMSPKINLSILPLLWWNDWLISFIFMREWETQRLFFVKAWCPLPQSLFWNISEVILRYLNRKVELTAETCRDLFKWPPLRFGLGLKLALQHWLVKLTGPNNRKTNRSREITVCALFLKIHKITVCRCVRLLAACEGVYYSLIQNRQTGEVYVACRDAKIDKLILI